MWLGSTTNGGRFFDGQVGEVKIYDEAFTPEEFADELATLGKKWLGDPDGGGGPQLQAGDSDQNLAFNQLDLVLVQVAAKYLTGQAATWGEGDWDGAPGGEPGSPPAGNGFFDQLDIIAALGNGLYLKGPYAAIVMDGVRGDSQTSIVYNADTGEVGVDTPAGVELISVNIDSVDVTDAAGRVLATASVKNRLQVARKKSDSVVHHAPLRLQIRDGGRKISNDPRILNARVFHCEWQANAVAK